MALSQNVVFGAGLVEMTIPRLIMLGIALVLTYLAISKKYEPLLLLPLAFGMLIANIPVAGLAAYDEGGLMNFLYQGIIRIIYPPLIFLCIGAMTDFGPLISNPRSALIGLGGQFGIFVAFWMSLFFGNLFAPLISGFDGFSLQQAASIAIIGSSDGPTSIYTATQRAWYRLNPVAVGP